MQDPRLSFCGIEVLWTERVLSVGRASDGKGTYTLLGPHYSARGRVEGSHPWTFGIFVGRDWPQFLRDLVSGPLYPFNS